MQMKMLGLLFVVFVVVGVIVAGSLQIPDQLTRWYFVGFLSCGSLVSMFASPLFVIVSSPQKCLQIFSKCAAFLIAWLVLFLQNLVIRTKSVEFMPFYLSLSTFLMSASFLLYGLFNSDAFVYVGYSSTVAIAIFQFIH